MTGIVYSETLVWAAPAAYVNDVPYQLAIVDIENGERVSVRIDTERVSIGDPAEFLENRDGVAYYRKRRLS